MAGISGSAGCNTLHHVSLVGANELKAWVSHHRGAYSVLELLKHVSTCCHLAILTSIFSCDAVWVVYGHAHCGHQRTYRSVYIYFPLFWWIGQCSTGKSFRSVYMFVYFYVIVLFRDESHSNTLSFIFTEPELSLCSMNILFFFVFLQFWAI